MKLKNEKVAIKISRSLPVLNIYECIPIDQVLWILHTDIAIDVLTFMALFFIVLIVEKYLK